LRSPFQLDHSAGKSEDILSQKEVQSSVDFCYLKLASMCNETLSLATFRRGSSEGRFSSVVLPQDQPISWLNQFGYPTDADPSPKQVLSQPAILCKLVDSGPLNINLTGALIENLSDHVGKENYGAVRRLAPHWIRNDSGLVSAMNPGNDSDSDSDSLIEVAVLSQFVLSHPFPDGTVPRSSRRGTSRTGRISSDDYPWKRFGS
jgi:hypothetical protein